MSTLAIAEFFVKPDRTEEFLAMLAAALPDTRAFEGCELIETYVNQDEPGHVFLIERWGSRSDHQAYLAWRTKGGMMEVVEPYSTAPPRFSYFDPRPDV